MAKELPVFPSASPSETSETEKLTYSRVFCMREDSPPLRLLLDFLKSKNQIPLIPKMDPEALDDWDWVHISLGYHRERKPIRLFCVREHGTYKDVYESEKNGFLEQLSVYDDVEAQIAREFIAKCKFIATTQMVQKDVSEEGYDFNGWILEFFQENCNGIVQIDGQGFFSPKGELVVDMEEVKEIGDERGPNQTTEDA
ncbi:MAG: hypothetical protein KC643_08670 [Nitrospira sp.]|nr:hypothetical protein [Nitrospira sp.]MCA9465502.1 hypothetical protein [Nitrospira sp.]MCA9481252.1 hypothetical protein [Nitrospira sp.]MCB9710293.1 hypothetical protein [Nitrospiraceae bacterium]